MPARFSQLLVVGPAQDFTAVLEQLEPRGYRLEAVADPEAARRHLLQQPADVVLLYLPAQEAGCRGALAWLRAVKEEVPVVVISSQADIRPYLAAMECGAFDYFTTLTPLAEIERVLASAARWRQRRVA